MTEKGIDTTANLETTNRELYACPECGRASDRILTEFDRTFPLPAVRVVRYRCENYKCTKPTRPGHPRRRTTWDVPAGKLKQVR